MALLDLLTRPPRLPRALDRPRLRRLLLDGVEPGQLIVAPPGSGKTVAAAQLLQAARAEAAETADGSGDDGRRTGWCRLAPGAAGGDDLVRLIGAALGTPVDDPGNGPLERAATVLDVLGDRSVLLVVDDYELARPEECDAVLAEVLGLVPPDCRLVVCSAVRPAGLVGRASVGQLAVVDADDLAFTADEVAGMLALLGHDPATAPEVHRASAGWATAVTVLAEGAGHPGPDLPTALEHLLDRAGFRGAEGEVLAGLAVAPALTGTELAAAGMDAQALGRLAAATALLRPVGDGWALLDVLREPVRRRLGAARLGEAAARIAPVLADRDPLAAAGLLLDAGDDAEAADLLARHASAVAPEAVVPLLYRMRPEVRRRLPPLLSGARATVEMDAALAGAEQRAHAAVDGRERAEAQVAVGTILLHRGQLASAAAALEAALRDRDAGTGGDVTVVAAATGWLGLARLWAGDLDGAAAALGASGARAGPVAASPAWALARWVAAELDLARHALAPPADREADLARVGDLVGELRAGGWTVAADAVAARLALAHGAETAAAGKAAAAYRAAAGAGGLDLLVAGPPHAWCLARAGRWSEARAVADELRRRLGAVDTCARLHADLIAEAHARATDDAVAVARHARDIATTRRLGYAPVEAVARAWLPAADRPAPTGTTTTASGLVVDLLGPVVVAVDGRRVDDRAWRSRKAREVLVLLALAGDAGRGREELIEAVWPDRDPAKGRSLLRTALADVRRVLEPQRPPGEASRFLTAHGDRLTLAAGTDLATAEQLRAAGDPGSLARAWALFRDELAADDPYADSLAGARRSAERLRLDVAQALVAGATGATGATAAVDPAALVAAAAFLHEREPWRADLAGPVAAACRAAGDEAAAARAERLLGSSGPSR